MKGIMLAILLGCAAIAQAGDVPPLRVSVHAEADNGLTGKLVSLISREFRGLDGVVLADEQSQYRVSCSVITVDHPSAGRIGYAASVAVTSFDGHLLMHFVHVDNSLESLAHETALSVDGGLLERSRRAATTAKP
jgi:hypothetical protein